MKIIEAKKRIKRQRSIAILIMAFSTLLLICSALKSLYFSMAGDTTALSPISHSIQRGVYFIYERTQFISWFWELAPVVNPQALMTSGNLGFLLVCTMAAISRMIWDSAANLSERIEKTMRKVEELDWQNELMRQRGQTSIVRPDIFQINIDLNQEDQWYKRPVGLILISVAGAVFAQLANLKFGFVKL